MLMNDISAQGNVDGYRDVVFEALAEDAASALGITSDRLLQLGLVDEVIPEPLGGDHKDPEKVATAQDALSKCLANAITAAHAFVDDVVHAFTGFLGHAKGTVFEAALDVFARVAEEGEFEVVDSSSAIHGNTGDDLTLNQINN